MPFVAKLLCNLTPKHTHTHTHTPLSSKQFSQGYLRCCLLDLSPKNFLQIKHNSQPLGHLYFFFSVDKTDKNLCSKNGQRIQMDVSPKKRNKWPTHEKKYSPPAVQGEMQIRSPNYHFRLLDGCDLKKIIKHPPSTITTQEIKCWQRHRTLIHCWWDCKMGQPLWEQFSQCP